MGFEAALSTSPYDKYFSLLAAERQTLAQTILEGLKYVPLTHNLMFS